MLSCSIWFSAPNFWIGGGLESRCLGRVYGVDGAVRRTAPSAPYTRWWAYIPETCRNKNRWMNLPSWHSLYFIRKIHGQTTLKFIRVSFVGFGCRYQNSSSPNFLNVMRSWLRPVPHYMGVTLKDAFQIACVSRNIEICSDLLSWRHHRW